MSFTWPSAPWACCWGWRRPVPAALFNLGFGLIDLYQVLAGLLGLFPAGLFALKAGDHLVHLVLGVALMACGLAGLRRR